MFRSKSKRLTRKLLTISFFLLAMVALLVSPAQRKVRAQERCIDCYPLYNECTYWCGLGGVDYQTCMLRCELDYSSCLWLCDPN